MRVSDIISERVVTVRATQTIADAVGRMAWPVARAMSGAVATVAPEADVGDAIDSMLENDVGAVAVVDEARDALVGIVSYVDVLRAVRRGHLD